MKHTYKKLKSRVGILLLIPILFLVSCERENTDPPHITNIRPVDPEMAGVSLEGAGLEEWIVIQGSGFLSVQEVFFNEYSASVNPVLVTENNIVIQVPAGAPNIGTDPSAPNTVRVVTKYGEDTYSDFIIFAPPAEVQYISNEFASAGDTIILLGRYFFLVDSVIFPDYIPAVEFTTFPDGSGCQVVVPDGTGSGPLRVISAGGIGGSVYGANFWDETGMICNFDNLNTWENWGGVLVNTATDGTFPELTGNAFLAEGSNIPTNTYWVQEMAMPIVSGPYPDYSYISTADYVFVKFEMFVIGPWNSGEYRFSLVRRDAEYNWVERYDYYIKPWLMEDGSIVDYETSSWVTMVIPLSMFTHDTGGDPIESFNDITDFDFLGCYFQNSGQIAGEQTIDHLQIGMDNIRMVGWDPTE